MSNNELNITNIQTDLAIDKFYHCDKRLKLLNLQLYKTLKIFLTDQFQTCIKHVIAQRLHNITQISSQEQDLWLNQGIFLPNINVQHQKELVILNQKQMNQP